jgi:hypothetical protein
MANATTIELGASVAGLTISTTSDAIHRALVVDAAPKNRHETVRISAAGHAEDQHADLSEQLRWETVADRLDASWGRHLCALRQGSKPARAETPQGGSVHESPARGLARAGAVPYFGELRYASCIRCHYAKA